MDDSFSIGKALQFGGQEFIPLNIIDTKYEDQNEDVLIINIANESIGVGTRSAGKQLRTFVQNLIDSKPGFVIVVNWENIAVISSSFADEFIGKLFVEIGQNQFNNFIKNININELIQQLLDKAILQRLDQSKTN